ncbi:MAG: GNAT family N-acetyltransferase [Oscillospiraceae bacterium]
MPLKFIDKAPTLEEYKEMRRLVNFMPLSDRICRNVLNNAFHITTVRDNGKCVGMIRVLSEGGYANFITDVIVIPEYQHQGIGKQMMHRTMDYLYSTLEPGEKIVVISCRQRSASRFTGSSASATVPTRCLAPE